MITTLKLCPKKLRAHARRAGVSQAQIATAMGVDRSTVNRWFKGGVPARPGRAARPNQPRNNRDLEDLANAVSAKHWRDIMIRVKAEIPAGDEL